VQNESASPDVDMLAASLRADSQDVAAFVESLARKLEDALPGRVRVGRARQGMFGPKVVRTIAVDAGNARLELERRDATVQARKARLSGGIVLAREALDIEAWLVAVSEALAAEAATNARTRQALERLLIG
jgi:hypothetical protein